MKLAIGDFLCVLIVTTRYYCTVDSFDVDKEYAAGRGVCLATVYDGKYGYPATNIYGVDIIQNFGRITYDEFKKQNPQRFI